MTSFALKLAGKQIGLGLTLVCSVVLLTLLFSFLGTITSAVLIGIILGASSHRRWHIFLVSLVFPGVIVALSQATQALPWKQTWVLAAICLGGYWFSYALTVALMWMEQGQDSIPDHSAPVSSAARPVAPEFNPPAAVAAAPDPIDITLDQLQGKWVFHSTNGQTDRKQIEIAGDQLALCSLGRNGEIRCLGQGSLQLQRRSAPPTPLHPSSSAPSAVNTAAT